LAPAGLEWQVHSDMCEALMHTELLKTFRRTWSAEEAGLAPWLQLQRFDEFFHLGRTCLSELDFS
jgi:hypothetical protein